MRLSEIEPLILQDYDFKKRPKTNSKITNGKFIRLNVVKTDPEQALSTLDTKKRRPVTFEKLMLNIRGST